MLFHDPLDLFEPDPENHRRLRFSPYPEGFAGSTMQFMAYYARNRGGFFLGTEDGAKGLKWYNFFKEDDHLCASILHKAAVVAPGRSFAPPYAVVLAPLLEGTWYEAGDRYRRWAWQQAWAQPGPRSRWLREVGGRVQLSASTPAMTARPGWTRSTGWPGRRSSTSWGPTGPTGATITTITCRVGGPIGSRPEFSAGNMATIARNGDYWAPFEFDLLCSYSADFPDPVLENRMRQNAPNWA